MNILAIDPGTKKMGYAFFRDGKLRSSGVVSFEKNLSKLSKFPERVYNIHQGIIDFLNDWEELPDFDVVVFENPFGLGCATAQINQMVGMFKTRMLEHCIDCEFLHYDASTVKKNFTGKGNATKEEMMLRAGTLYSLPDVLEDETDAIAVGHCYLDNLKGDE